MDYFIFKMDDVELGIFDHSGVLSDDRKPVYEANMLLLEEYGKTRITFQEWLLASMASAGELVRSFGVDVPVVEINQSYEEIYTALGNRDVNPLKPIMYADVPVVLNELHDRGLKLAIVSSHPRSNLIKELRGYGVLELFDEVSGDPMQKTERLKDICFDFCVSRDRAFFVEDTVYGLRSGYEAGVSCFGITTGYHSRERLEREGTAVAVIDSLTELLDYV